MLVEQELIEKARGGDGAAFNDIVLAYRKRIMGTISRLIGRPEDVEDVAQEVFVRLYYSLISCGRRKCLSRGCID